MNNLCERCNDTKLVTLLSVFHMESSDKDKHIDDRNLNAVATITGENNINSHHISAHML